MADVTGRKTKDFHSCCESGVDHVVGDDGDDMTDGIKRGKCCEKRSSGLMQSHLALDLSSDEDSS
jgi:hypothetical protein